MKRETIVNFVINAVVFGLIFMLCSCKAGDQDFNSDKAWERAENIIQDIKVPQFPDRSFNVTDFGAKADGVTDNTEVFKKAIDACNAQGGGKVLVPAGRYVTGPIHLKSNVNFHLAEGAEILFSKNKSAYLPVVHTSYEGMELMNYSPLIYAYGQKNIAVTGKGVFNGQADNDNWWPWAGKDEYGYKEGDPRQHDDSNLPRLRQMVADGVPVTERVFGEGNQLRPTFFEPFECENILVEGVTFTNAPFWIIHPIKSNNITVDGVTVRSHGPNNDGCDPEYSKNVHIKNSIFDTGDDCIAIKSGRNNDGRRVNIPSENIVVENCEMADGHGGVVMGSEISAGVRNVFVRNCRMDSPNLDRAIRIKTNTIRGGFVDGVYVKDLQVGQVKEAVLKINTYYAIYDNQEGDYIPEIRNIFLENVEVENGGKYGLLIKGREQSPVQNVQLKNVSIKSTEVPLNIENCEPVKFINTTINGKAY
ncbi:glycoside hydrolase family 28 protein [Gramella jeungdoensis]|uniref:Glycoside hydrolase family 28 protein n=1 Tax=Gramella jeungdoensis TaxID=708091 RepID=A0ABT0YY80_9FLAO|nr:glycoside hydrolase family 28 protein [Gramella jeungdoensis]MCM8568421.1 glycoside hydrolase family 28 protein [Gramella jeungdoensis]